MRLNPLRWLRRLILRWLSENEPPSRLLQCYTPKRGGGKELQTYMIDGAVGTRLRGSSVSSEGHGVRLLGEGEAADPGQYRALWRMFQGTANLRWENGDRVEV